MKKGEIKTTGWLLIIVVAVFLAWNAGWIHIPAQSASPEPDEGNNNVPPSTFLRCPDDGTTNLKIEVKNTANDTGSEAFDVTGYLYKLVDGREQYVTAITDTTDPSATEIDCGYDYVFKVVGTNGASGDTSYIKKVFSGDGDVKVQNGNLYFTASGPSENIVIGMDQHATLECRAWDYNQGDFIYDSSDTSNTDYETDPVTFTSTTDNTTPMDETLGLDIGFKCRAVESDTNYNDRGVLVLVEAPTNTWDEPVVYLNGQKLSEATTLLNDDERRAYADYEYVYLIPASVNIKDGAEGIELRFKMDLLSGVSSASADPEIDFAVRTQYLSTLDGITVKQGAVKDDSSTTQIIDIYDITVDVT